MIRINLLPQEERAQRKKALALPAMGMVVPVVAVGLFVALLAGVTMMQQKKISGLKGDIARAEDEARRLKPQIDRVNELTKRREELNTRLQIISDLDKGRFHSVRLMDDIAQELPQYIWMTGIKDQGGSRVQIEGVTFSNLVVADLMSRLESSDLFEKVDLVVTEKGAIEGRDVTKFSVTADITPGSTTKPLAAPAGPLAQTLSEEAANGY